MGLGVGGSGCLYLGWGGGLLTGLKKEFQNKLHSSADENTFII